MSVLVLTLAIETSARERRIMLARTRRQHPGVSIEVADGKPGSPAALREAPDE